MLGQVGAVDADPEEMRAAVEESITGDYELLGEMRRKEGGGRVYFAREKSTGRIAALRLTKGQTDGEFELGETRILRKSKMADAGMALSVTQLLRPIDGADVPAERTPDRPAARPAIPNELPPPVQVPGPKGDWVVAGTGWAKRNWGPLAGVGVGALLALLGWAAMNG